MQIVIVVVLYKRSPQQSQTIQSLAQVFGLTPGLLQSYRVFVWDNTPTALADLTLSVPR